MFCILSAVFQLRALLYVLCAFVILNKDYLSTYKAEHRLEKEGRANGKQTAGRFNFSREGYFVLGPFWQEGGVFFWKPLPTVCRATGFK